MSDNSGYSAAQLREAQNKGDINILQDAGLLKPKQIKMLSSFRRAVDDAEENEEYQDMLHAYLSQNTSEAVKNGNVSQMQYATGIVGGGGVDLAEADAAHQKEAILDFFRAEPKITNQTNKVFQIVIFSSEIPPTGKGKTSTGYKFVEYAKEEIEGLIPLTNNPSDPYKDTPKLWSELLQEIMGYDGWNILMLDEAAQFLQYADQGAGKTVSQMMKLLRHHKCHLILIAHTGMDVPADIRRQMYFMDKHGEKNATIGYGLKNNNVDDRMEIVNEIMSLNNIPHTNTPYKSQGEQTIQIEFDDPDDKDEKSQEESGVNREKVEAVADYLSSDEGLRTVAERHDVSYGGLRKWVNEMSPDEE